MTHQKLALSESRRGGKGAARWILSAPLLILIAVLVIWPMYAGIKTAFSHDVLSEFEITPAGVSNFLTVLKDPQFWSSAWFTTRYAVMACLLEMVMGFGLALLFDRKFPGKRLLFSAVLVPIMIAPSLMGVMYRLLLNENVGLVPGLLSLVNIKVSLFGNSSIVPLLVLLDVVQYLPFTFLLFYSSLQSFPQDLNEAASIDGAGYWRTVVSVVAPVLAPAFIVTGLLRLLDALRTFDVVYILTGGGPGTQTTTLGIYIYKKAFVEGDFGVAAASALVLVFLLTPLIPAAVRRLVRES